VFREAINRRGDADGIYIYSVLLTLGVDRNGYGVVLLRGAGWLDRMGRLRRIFDLKGWGAGKTRDEVAHYGDGFGYMLLVLL